MALKGVILAGGIFTGNAHSIEMSHKEPTNNLFMGKKYEIARGYLFNEYFDKIKSQDEIAGNLGVSQWVVSQRMKDFNLKTRDRTWKFAQYRKSFDFDESFFDKITEENAWVLGWLLSDGFVQKYKKSFKFGIKVAEKDSDVIYKIKSLLKFTGNIYREEQWLKKTGKKYRQVRLQIGNKKIVEKLERMGIAENKTKNAKFLDIIKETDNEKIIKSFILGVFEGDGSILFDEKRKSLLFQIVGTKELLLDVQKYLIKYLKLGRTKLTNNIKGTNHFALRYRGRFQALKIFDWLYADANNYLDRKYERYLELSRRLRP